MDLHQCVFDQIITGNTMMMTYIFEVEKVALAVKQLAEPSNWTMDEPAKVIEHRQFHVIAQQ